ncbi:MULTISPECIES: hypothetical protein [Lysinibacillus]|uniref:hypothetical protein n=1 Tax=Lysinibacillus TaxID=400634 RepID=UPI00083C95CE|nr:MULTISPECIES: hypothetical protein [Lysinibacillus]
MQFEGAMLEYRLQKEKDKFEPIYYYTNIDLPQILTRRECEFFIKEGKTYKQLSSAIEGELFVIYVQLYEETPIEMPEHLHEGIKLEIRELNAYKNYPLITFEYMTNHLDILSIIGSIYTYIEGKEWERDSAEIDEDQGVYVLYVKPTGYTLIT